MRRGFSTWIVNLRIATKLAACFGILIAIFLGSVAVTYPSLLHIEASDGRAVEAFQILDATKTVWIDVLQQESDVRGYLLLHEAYLLDRARSGDAEVQASLKALSRFATPQPLQRVRVERLSTLIATWRGQIFANLGPDEKSFGAEGALNRILRTLREIDEDNKRDLAARDLVRANAFMSAYWINGLAPLVALIVAALLGWVVHRLFTQPIARLVDTMRYLARGDTSIEIPFTRLKEEIGAISRALAIFQQAVHDAARLRDEKSAGEERAAADRATLMMSMADRFETVVGAIVADVSTSAQQMQASAEALLNLAEWTTADIRTVTAITKQASTTMRDVALGTQDLSDAVGDINGRMAHSTDVARKAVAEADHTTESVRDLEQSAEKVEAIVALINGIALNTNMLALNAAIEAARAGDAGRGFSVVANEVKGLADQTAKATIQIRDQISGIRAAASGAGDSIGKISRTIAQMAHATRDMSGVLETQGLATRNMMQGTWDSARLSADVSSQLDKVSEGAATTGQAATGLLSSARILSHQSSVLREEAERFVASVRAG